MIKITVASYNNQAAQKPLSAVFGRDGGTLGRSDENHLVLPDPKSLVSRTQASIKSDGGRHTIVNLSVSNPILVNGKEIDFEREYPIKAGDEIRIGLYTLNVEPHLIAVDGKDARELGTSAVAVQQEPAAPISAGDAAPAVDGEALMKAFLQGAGIPNVTINWQMTPEFMETIGKLLATSIGGTFELLDARAHVKREVNADMTMVVVRSNNPLKFLSDSPTVLTQMLRKKMPGFMAPVEAMEDAYADLKAHQDGVMAGMHGAVDDALHRLDPHAIEAQQQKGGPLDAMIPSRRKAEMWDRYCELHAQLARGARKDFHGTFGKAFVRAYEKHVEHMQDKGRND
jgi:FHA domain-containing protein